MSDMFHIKAIEIIAKSLRGAVANTDEGREGMALGQYIAGMGFSNVGLGIVHSMAHQLGAVYDTPHGIANAILLPTVMRFNGVVCADRFKEILCGIGMPEVKELSDEEAIEAAVADYYKRLGVENELTKKACDGCCDNCSHHHE